MTNKNVQKTNHFYFFKMGLTEEQKQEITNLVAKYDKSGNGKLEYDEFLSFMKEG